MITIDARGLRCPLPVLKTEKYLADAAPGSTVVVLATDPIARIDIPLYCRQNGHDVEMAERDGALTFTITKSGA